MIGPILAGLATYRVIDRYMTGTTEVPIWTGHLNGDLSKPAMVLTKVREKGKVTYRVSVVMEGNNVEVGRTPTYAGAIAVIQNWDSYLRHGGTVERWLLTNRARVTEVNELEEAWKK